MAAPLVLDAQRQGVWQELFEEFRLPELKGLGDQVGRKRFDQDIEVAHGTVVIPTRQLYLLINLGQVFLKLDKGPVGL